MDELTRLIRFNGNVYRIVGRDGFVLALVVAHSDKTWGLYDRAERLLTGERFAKPSAAHTAFREITHT